MRKKRRVLPAVVDMLVEVTVSIRGAVRLSIGPLRLILAAWGLVLCLPTVAGTLDAQNEEKVDKLFAQWDRADSPGAAVVVVKDSAVIYQHGYGSADLEHHVPITPQTTFDAASVAKQFTGMSVAMLVKQGRLSVDDDIRKYVTVVPDFGKTISIQNLLHHTSGLRDWPETLALSGIDWEGPITLDMILEMVQRQRELDFAPGEEYQYSNTGYNLLAAAVAKITGQSFRTWTDANLFQPLGMTHTFVCDDPAEIMPDRARSYSANRGKFYEVASRLAAQGSSSLFISAEDMGKWLLNFETAHVGGEAAIEMMQQPGKLNSGAEVPYGFGLAWGQYRGMKVINHTGSWAGYRSAVMRLPGEHLSIAILSNVDNLDPYGLSQKIAELYLSLPAEREVARSVPKPHAHTKVDPTRWGDYLGTYLLGPHWLLSITREGNQLMAQATAEPKFSMTPLSRTEFFVEAYGASIEFIPDKSGVVENLRYRGINAPKLSPTEPPPGGLAAYVGDYWSEELMSVVRLEVHDGKLAYCNNAGSWTNFCRPEGTISMPRLEIESTLNSRGIRGPK